MYIYEVNKNKKGRLKETEDLYVQVVVARRKILGEDHPETWESVKELALIYRYQGRFKEAENLYVHVVAARKKVLGEEHPEIWEPANDISYSGPLEGGRGFVRVGGGCEKENSG